ncbi:MAG TPA: class II aldolase/adducin family protein [Chloroflexota bacterium]
MASAYERLVRQLIIANRVLARLGVLDAFGHVSFRHPEHADRFVMSRARAPELVTPDDLQTYNLQGEELTGDTRNPYTERFIHAAIYEARSDIQAVCHNHSPAVIPFGTTKLKLRPLYHVAGVIGAEAPVWDIAEEFGDGTDLLVRNLDMGRSLARTVGTGNVALMRGHGSAVAAPSLPAVTYVGVYMQENARAALLAELLGQGQVRYLSPAETAATGKNQLGPIGSSRAWEAWCAQIGMTDED